MNRQLKENSENSIALRELTGRHLYCGLDRGLLRPCQFALLRGPILQGSRDTRKEHDALRATCGSPTGPGRIISCKERETIVRKWHWQEWLEKYTPYAVYQGKSKMAICLEGEVATYEHAC